MLVIKKNMFIYIYIKQEKKNVSLKFKFLSIKKHVGNKKKIHVFCKYINKKRKISLSKIQILIFLINIYFDYHKNKNAFKKNTFQLFLESMMYCSLLDIYFQYQKVFFKKINFFLN
jgi:hypothetical protein